MLNLGVGVQTKKCPKLKKMQESVSGDVLLQALVESPVCVTAKCL